MEDPAAVIWSPLTRTLYSKWYKVSSAVPRRSTSSFFLTVRFIQAFSNRTYMKCLTYKRVPLRMEDLLDHAWSGRLTAASVTFAKMEVISVIGLSLATLREVCMLCSAVDGDKDAAWTESTTVVMDDNKVLILVSNERIPFVLLVSQDMKHTSFATFSHGVVLSINESTSCRKSSMRK